MFKRIIMVAVLFLLTQYNFANTQEVWRLTYPMPSPYNVTCDATWVVTPINQYEADIAITAVTRRAVGTICYDNTRIGQPSYYSGKLIRQGENFFATYKASSFFNRGEKYDFDVLIHGKVINGELYDTQYLRTRVAMDWDRLSDHSRAVPIIKGLVEKK